MRSYLLFLLSFCLVLAVALPAHAQEVAPITVIVTLRRQADLSRIAVESDPAVRRRQIVVALQSTAQTGAGASAQALALQAAAGDEVLNITPFWIFNGFAITASPRYIARLAASPDVLSITPDELPIAPAGARAVAAAVEPNLAAVQAVGVWGLGWRGQGVVVANLDTGVDGSHPDLAPRWRGGGNSWFDPFGEHPVTPYDANGHGTWTMGVMVGGSAGGSAIGVAPGAQWIAAKIFDDQGRSSATAIHLAYQWLLDPDGNPATDDAPDVVNNSWTFTAPGCYLEFERDLQMLRAAGILPIFAAGNSGPAAGTSLSPGNNPSAFAVGATDNDDQVYFGSSRGPSACDGSMFPHMSAPGVAIRSSSPYGEYVSSTGTSFAAPHVAGILALLLSAFPDLATDQQQEALLASVRDLGPAGPDNDYGAGKLNGMAAYAWLASNGFEPQGEAPIPIHAIQGAGHVSPLVGQTVATTGVVTAWRSDGFYLQDPSPDDDAATSEAVFVATSGLPTYTVGEQVRVVGRVAEVQPTGLGSAGLSVTQVVAPAVSALPGSGRLPAPVILGAGGRQLPDRAIDNDGMTTFDIEEDSLDLLESLEHMRVQVDNAVVVGPSDATGGMWVLADGGMHASPRTGRGGILETQYDGNPERIHLDGTLYGAGRLPDLAVGARIVVPVVGVLDYLTSTYVLQVTETLATDTATEAAPETTELRPQSEQITVAAYDMGGIDGAAGVDAVGARAAQIVENLATPDIILLQNIKVADAEERGAVDAPRVVLRLAAAIAAAGGPAYVAVQPGAENYPEEGDSDVDARLGLLYNPSRVQLDALHAAAAAPAVIACAAGKAELVHNPGLLESRHTPWSVSAKPLVVQLLFEGRSLFVIGMELISQAGDAPRFGALQPPPRLSDARRQLQAEAIGGFVEQITGCDARANVLVLGNANDLPNAWTLAPFEQGGLYNLLARLPLEERYTTIVEGNSAAYQHAYVSPALLGANPQLDVVHLNAEFPASLAEHDPLVVRLTPIDYQQLQPIIFLPYIGLR